MEYVTMRIWAAALSVLLLLVPAGVWALGLGNIEVGSTLNEPLRARVDLTSVQDGDLDSMQVQLASVAQFKRAGIQRPFQLSKLKFTAVGDGDDSGHINVTTRGAVVEPFLNFLIEVTWPRGRIVREYTILLDPPVYGTAISSKAKKDLAEIQARALQEQPVSEPVPAADPRPATSQAAPAPVEQPSTSTGVAPAPAPTPAKTVAAAPSPEPAPVPTMAAAPMPMPTPMHASDLPDAYDVKNGDTLWSLATRYRPDSSVSIQRMMLAMLSANPDAFNIPNINALRAGTVLHIPDVAQFGGTDRQVVLAEVNRQHEIWLEYRQGLAAAAPTAPEGTSVAATEPQPAAEPAAAATRTPMQPEQAATETQSATGGGDRLALVSGGRGTEGVGSPSSDSPNAARDQQDLALALEEADAKTREAEELGSRVAELEGILDDLQRAIQLRDDNMAALQEMLASVEQEADGLRTAAEQARSEAAAAGVTGEPMVEIAPEPVLAVTPEPVVEATPEPVVEATPEPVVEVTPEPVVAVTPEPVVEATPEPVVAVTPEPVVEATPGSESPRTLPSPPPSPSFFETFLESLPGDPALLGAGLGGLLVVLGGAALWRRRRNAEDVEDLGALDLGALDDTDLLYDDNGEPYLPDDVGGETAMSELEGMDVSAEQAEPQAAEADLLDPAPMSVDFEDDPLTEVNVYLAYERYDQAEELVRSTIAQHPDHHEYKLRLLEVFYAAKDLGKFESGARELQDAAGADSSLLAEAHKMWRDMSPGRELFSAAESAVPEDLGVEFDVTGGAGDETAAIPVSSDEQSGALDFDLGFESDGAKPEAASGESSIDFDLGFDQATGAEPGDGSSLDLDLTSIDAGSVSNLDFDVGGEAAAEADAGSAGIEFELSDIDEPMSESQGPSTETMLPDTVSEGSDDLDFDLEALGEGTSIDGQAPPGAPPAAMPEPPATADADDGGFDFDFDAIGGDSEGVESGATSIDTEFTALDLNLDAVSGVSQLSAMDIDAGDDLTAIGDDAASALGFDVGSDSVDAGAGPPPDDDFDFGLDLDDGDATDETVKLDLSGALLGNDFDEQPDTVELQSPEMDAADSAISNFGLDLNLDMDAPDSAEPSTGVDTAFEGLFEDESAVSSEDDMALSLDGADLIPPTPPPPADAEPDFPEIDLDFGAESNEAGAASDAYEATQVHLRGQPTSQPANSGPGEGHTLVLGGGLTGEVDEVQTKLDLAQAYIDMGDTDGAKGIIDEVLGEGNAAQKQAALGLLSKMA